MKNRIVLLTILWLTCLEMVGQTDTVVSLNPYQVKGFDNQLFSGNRKNYINDSLILQAYALNELSVLLGSVFPIYIKNYGYGMSSGISLRGSGSNHTAMNWNGINLNSPTLGTALLSSGIPFLTDGIAVVPGAGSATSGSGAIGGSIELTDQSTFSRGLFKQVNFYSGLGAFGTYQTAAAYKVNGLSKSQDFRLFYQSSENNFRYVYNGERETNKGADMSSLHLKYRASKIYHNKTTVWVSAWYEQNRKGLQQGMGTSWNASRMNDAYLRTLVHVARPINKYISVHSRAALLMDDMNYQSLTERSQNRVWRGLFETYIHATAKTVLSYKAGMVTQQFFLSGSAYAAAKQENRADLFAFLSYKLRPELNIYTNFRKIFIDGASQPWCYDLGIYFNKQTHGLLYKTAVRASSNFRLPTLNERFWWPGGNPALNPEISRQVEGNLELNYKWGRGGIGFNSNIYHNRILNWIQWIPGSATVWRPVNLTEVWITGSEYILEAQQKAGKWLWTSRCFINASFSTIIRNAGLNEGKQLIYTPFNQAGGQVGVFRRQVALVLLYQYHGFAFTSTDNRNWLPSFHLCHLTVSKLCQFKLFQIAVSGQINNLLNTRYQTMENFALPGRNFSIRLQFKYQKSS